MKALRERGHSDEMMLSTGIAVQYDDSGPLLDKPRGGGYLALPLSNPNGAIIGIKYRAVVGEVDDEARRFDATSSALSGAMFGFDRLPEQAETVIAVEGELDQLSLAAAREADPTLPPAVAWHGKELSGERLSLLSGRAKHVVLMLDSDDGGFDGILRGGRKLARAGVEISVVRMPAGVDPNELLRAGDASGLARAVHHLPRVSLFEEHARTLTRFGPREENIARTDPNFAASELRETAEALVYAGLEPEAVARGAHLVNLDHRHFAPYVAKARERQTVVQATAATMLTHARVSDYDVDELLSNAIEVEADRSDTMAAHSAGVE
ncbi:MAG: toprim domain-containing protein [Gemmatimonadaceae bacterium]